MYLAFKYAKRKYREGNERKANDRDDGGQQQMLEPTSNYASPDGVITAPAPAITSPASKKEKKELTLEERVEQKRRRNYRYKIIFGLMAPFTLQALDTTIIASALPFIAADFNEIPQLNWIISSFNLTTTAFLPLWAQIADIFGRPAALYATIAILSVGSAICTGAPTSAFGALLLGRALQGMGAAGINICVRTILADRVSLAEYSTNWTIFALFSAASYSVGPVAGGYLTNASWRWCFGINLPVAAVAVVLAVVLLRGELLGPQALPELEEKRQRQRHQPREGAGEEVLLERRRRRRNKETRKGRFLLRLATIDYGGQLLFLWGFGLLILAFTWAGGTYAWSSPAVVAPLVVGLVLAVAWLLYERSMAPGGFMARRFPLQRAMMPWQLLTQRDIGLLLVVNFTVGAAMFAILYFMELYFALVEGRDAASAGVALLYFLPGLGAGAFSSSFFINLWPGQTLPCLILGGVTSAVGVTVLAWATHARNTSVIYGMMALTGYGVGMRFNPGSLHGLAYFPGMTAAISCLVSFALPFGGTLTLTLMSTVFNNRSGPNQSDPKSGIMWAFISIIPIVWIGVFVTLFLGNVWILKDGAGHEVVHGPWLWSLLTGRRLERVKIVEHQGPAGEGEIMMQGVGPDRKVNDMEAGRV
ncbi:major facilitator superfamily domain-containing protein [Bombardia bombarda]|uniref:Major facilitator superfamily domain-containing protein n=1 Tax=Bombardia bombarda TaxID=252184 RepID=A0AA39X146_9PEZI|nr:major facilitator superfamily domain-containing protein [Bombardia bombarda]